MSRSDWQPVPDPRFRNKWMFVTPMHTVAYDVGGRWVVVERAKLTTPPPTTPGDVEALYDDAVVFSGTLNDCFGWIDEVEG